MFAGHQDKICCVVSDVTMPRMNGWETVIALRGLSPGIPVILCSGYDEAQVLVGDHPERPQAFPAQTISEGGTAGGLGKSDERLSRVRSNGQKSAKVNDQILVLYKQFSES